MPPWIVVGYALVDFAANVDFVRDNFDFIWGSPFFSVVIFIVGIVWLVYVSSRQGEQRAGRPGFISIERVKQANLGDRTYEGVEWRVSIRNGEVSVGDPRCPTHNKALEYKPSYHITLPKLDFFQPIPTVTKPDTTSLFADLLAADMPTLEPETSPELEAILKEQEKRKEKEEAEEKEREELGLKALTQGDSSGENHGPYCFECRKLWPFSKTVGQCQYDIRSEVEAELRSEAEEFCD